MSTPNLIIGDVAKRQQERNRRDESIFLDFSDAMAAGSAKTDAAHFLMEKYRIRAYATFLRAVRRGESLVKESGAAVAAV
jgi:hypothetical protein